MILFAEKQLDEYFAVCWCLTVIMDNNYVSLVILYYSVLLTGSQTCIFTSASNIVM